MGDKPLRYVSTPDLRKMWERERRRLAAKPDATVGDYADLIAMRAEIDRREGDVPPVDFDFEKYITD